ncbi:MAG: hypothetical protein NXH85_17845 [Pseudomonadaceae bacterium]|nr:hypothetical protein [Pseudomonadaceae bacterium]
MKVVKRSDEYTIFERRDGRHAVRNAQRQWVNGDEKTAILSAQGLIKAPPVKAPEPEPAAEEEQVAEAPESEAPAEEAAAEDSGDEKDA